ncbi:MAG: hypothetical protein M1820_000835 [Bogoriella megaspora]|nr:MAG: hypothetical protein M1820_000835 [Bogoriella megaspora]
MRIVVYKHPTSDFMFDSSVLVFWDFLDASFAVIVANMPVYYTVVDAVVIRSRRLLGLHSSKKRSDQSKESSTPSAGTYKDQKPYLPDYDQRTEGHKTPVSILKNARSDVESGRSQSKFADGDSDDIELLEVTDKDLRSNSSRRGFR